MISSALIKSTMKFWIHWLLLMHTGKKCSTEIRSEVTTWSLPFKNFIIQLWIIDLFSGPSQVISWPDVTAYIAPIDRVTVLLTDIFQWQQRSPKLCFWLSEINTDKFESVIRATIYGDFLVLLLLCFLYILSSC